MQELHAGIHAGAEVYARGERWLVVHTRPYPHCALVSLEGRDVENAGRRVTLVSPFDTIVPPAARPLVRRRRAGVLRRVLAAAAGARPGSGLWTGVDARFDLLPWQLAPALAVLGGATRVLLADGVGLGKTVQAALVLAELAGRGLVERALVLAPAGLRETWAAELVTRFGLDVAVIDQAAVIERSRHLAAGANPWASAPVIVSSIDFVKRADVRAALDEVPIDLLIADEAHHLTPGTDRGALVARLARTAPWVILASATPHGGDPGTFRALLDVGVVADGVEAPMQVFRRTHRDAGLTHARSTHLLPVKPTPTEGALLEALRRYAQALCHGPRGDAAGLRLVASVLARRATSSALAVERTLQRRLAALSGAETITAFRQPSLPWTEADPEDQTDPDAMGLAGLADVGEECRLLAELVALARRATAQPSKFVRLGRLLQRMGEPAIVFTEFRDTLDACLPFLEPLAPVACLHGGLDSRERRQALDRFLGGNATVLVATDVAGEGLNLQARARTVVTIEWPWSPQRLEQRIGRVDRLGQRRRVHAIHLTARGTYEDTVVARLLGRAARAQRDLAAPTEAIPEQAVLARIVGDATVASDPTFRATPPVARDPAAVLEAERLAWQRRLASRARHTAPNSVWSLPRRRRPTTRVAVIVEVSRQSPTGRLEWTTPVAVAVTLARAPAHRRAWKEVCRALAGDRRIHDVAVQAAAGTTSPGWQSVVDRIGAIRRALEASAPASVQPSLFDRRAIRASSARDASRAAHDARLARLAELLKADGREAATDARVVAVVPLDTEPAR